MTIKFPVGIDDFKELIQGSYKEVFVDKTLLIKSIIDEGAKTILIARPRRFGKTLNMSMLRYFFSNENVEENRELFNETKIVEAITEDEKSYMDFQGKYPVIFITLKRIRNIPTYELAYKRIAATIGDMYKEHRYLLDSDKLYEDEKLIYQQIVNEQADISHLQDSLKKLTEYIHRYYNKKPIILLDEYDSPFHSSYTAENKYHKEMLSFMGGFLGEAFKGNEHLYKGVITGILRISLMNLFSGTNNIRVYSVLRRKYAEYFGFTEEEIIKLVDKTSIDINYKEMADWYNGYEIGGVVLYNPWSVICCLDSDGIMEPYWLDTGEYGIIGESLRHKDFGVKLQIQKLLTGDKIEADIDQRTVFTDLEENVEAVWGLLAYSGYLKVLNTKIQSSGKAQCMLAIPNNEVYGVYTRFISDWYEEGLGLNYYKKFMKSLVEGDIEYFQSQLKDYLDQSISYFDLGKKTPEKVYHVFILGLIAALRDKYIIKSNKEVGMGRFDITMIPRDNKKQGVILEFKSVKTERELKKEAGTALKQIEKNKYNAELKLHDVKEAMHIGISFSGKNVCVKSSYKKYDS